MDEGTKVLLFNDGAITGRYAAARRILGEPGIDQGELAGVAREAVYAGRHKEFYHAESVIGLDGDFMVKAHL